MLKASFYPSSLSIHRFATNYSERVLLGEKTRKEKISGWKKKDSEWYCTASTSPYPTPNSFP